MLRWQRVQAGEKLSGVGHESFDVVAGDALRAVREGRALEPALHAHAALAAGDRYFLDEERVGHGNSNSTGATDHRLGTAKSSGAVIVLVRTTTSSPLLLVTAWTSLDSPRTMRLIRATQRPSLAAPGRRSLRKACRTGRDDRAVLVGVVVSVRHATSQVQVIDSMTCRKSARCWRGTVTATRDLCAGVCAYKPGRCAIDSLTHPPRGLLESLHPRHCGRGSRLGLGERQDRLGQRVGKRAFDLGFV